MQFSIDNVGISGTPFLTFTINTSPNKGFTQDDLDNDLTACVITGNNKVGKGEIGDKLFGKVVWVSQELQAGTTIPALCAVQARGVARFKYDRRPPFLGESVLPQKDGKVIGSPTGDGLNLRGIVIAVDEENQTCDLWL